MVPFDVDAPSLADAYEAPRHALRAEIEVLDAGGAPRTDDAIRFQNHVTTGKVGGYVMLGGLGVAVLGGVVIVASPDPASALGGAGLVLVGALGVVGGEVALFYGGIAAANDGRRLGLHLSPTVGWVGVGLVGASLVLSSAGSTPVDVAPTPAQQAMSTAGSLASLAGLGCAIGQLSMDIRRGRDGGVLAVAPQPNGILVAGRF